MIETKQFSVCSKHILRLLPQTCSHKYCV